MCCFTATHDLLWRDVVYVSCCVLLCIGASRLVARRYLVVVDVLVVFNVCEGLCFDGSRWLGLIMMGAL